MNVHGSHRFAAPREAVFDAIRDPGALLAVIPGCEAVTEVAADEYEGFTAIRKWARQFYPDGIGGSAADVYAASQKG